MEAKRVDTWAAEIEDNPGGLAGKLTALAAAGANLEFVIARRNSEKPGTGVVFVTPIKGAKQIRAAEGAGFTKTSVLHTVRIEGSDKPGEGARLAKALGDKGMNLRGLSAAAIGRKFVSHIALDSEEDAAKAVRIVRTI